MKYTGYRVWVDNLARGLSDRFLGPSQPMRNSGQITGRKESSAHHPLVRRTFFWPVNIR
jgi:hypothetical protein